MNISNKFNWIQSDSILSESDNVLFEFSYYYIRCLFNLNSQDFMNLENNKQE